MIAQKSPGYLLLDAGCLHAVHNTPASKNGLLTSLIDKINFPYFDLLLVFHKKIIPKIAVPPHS
jgi:hypothetical protein